MLGVFITGDDLGSRLIRNRSGGPSSHVGILLPDGGIIDSTIKHGVKPRTYREFIKNRYVVGSFDVACDDDKAHEFLFKQEGKPYDYTALFGFAAGYDFQEDDSWYCYELFIAAAIAGGREVLTNSGRIFGKMAIELGYQWSRPHMHRSGAARQDGPGWHSLASEYVGT